MNFNCKTSCNNCPYRKDAPVALWDKREFIDLMKNEDSPFGTVYGCHKNNGEICVGFLMNQDKRNFPSIKLRMALINNKIDRKHLDSLQCKSEMFESIEEMSEANFPELKV